jgi:uncharacterized protein YjbI with pentapeptide repeats
LVGCGVLQDGAPLYTSFLGSRIRGSSPPNRCDGLSHRTPLSQISIAMINITFIVIASAVLLIKSTHAWKLSRGSQPVTARSQPLKSLATGLLLAVGTFGLLPVEAQDQFRLPPIDRNDKDRCIMVSSAMGQANAARQKLFDLRECDLRNQDGKLKDMSGVIGSNADFRGVSFVEGQLSKGYLRSSNFAGADFTNGVVDRVTFDGSDLKGAIFKNAVLSGTTFAEANLEDTDFTDAYLGPFDLKNLCANPTLKGTNPTTKEDTRFSAGCGE